MGGAIKSIGGFLGTSSGPTIPVSNNNYDLGQLSQYLNSPDHGTAEATQTVQSNPVLGQLFGQGGELSQALGKEQQLQSQGFQLTPEDQTLYGQASDNIARQYGQTGNAVATNLAMRGLASAPSGAAGAMFSGVQGNQNEALAQAQEQIMQQRFQNTMKQIGQQQQFITSLGGQANNAIQGQRQGTINGYGSAAGLQNQQNQEANNANLASSKFEADNKPANFMDYYTAGTGSSLYGVQAAPGTFAQGAAGGAGAAAGKSAGSLFR